LKITSETHLNQLRYESLQSADYDKSLCLVPNETLQFIQDTQPEIGNWNSSRNYRNPRSIRISSINSIAPIWNNRRLLCEGVIVRMHVAFGRVRRKLRIIAYSTDFADFGSSDLLGGYCLTRDLWKKRTCTFQTLQPQRGDRCIAAEYLHTSKPQRSDRCIEVWSRFSLTIGDRGCIIILECW